jgi:hypothetical protein
MDIEVSLSTLQRTGEWPDDENAPAPSGAEAMTV